MTKMPQDGHKSAGETDFDIKDEREELYNMTCAEYIKNKLAGLNKQDLFELSQKHRAEEEI